MPVLTEIPSPPAPQPLPWRWFQFRRTPIFPTLPLPIDPDAVYALNIDAHPIAFKFLHLPSPTPRPVALLLHGMGLTIASFRAIAPYLLATHDLLLPDYSGFSQDNSPLPDHASIINFAHSVWHLADALNIPRLALVGSSLGGGLSLMAALLNPHRIDRIILSNPACFPQQLPKTYRLARIPLLGELLILLTPADKLVAGIEYVAYVDKSRFDPALRHIYISNYSTRRNRLRLMQLIRQLPANSADLTTATHLPHLSTLRVPILLSWGQQDLLLAPTAGTRLAAALPHVTFDLYPNLSHLPHEESPESLGPRWSQFLNAQQPRIP